MRVEFGNDLYIFPRREIRHQIISLENKTELAAPECRQFMFRRSGQISTVKLIAAGCELCHAAQNIQQRRLA